MRATRFEVMPPPCPDTFPEHWVSNGDPNHPAYAAGVEASQRPFDPEAPPETVDIVEVTLRDGLQQRTYEADIKKYTEEVVQEIIAKRTEIFDAIVAMGHQTIEIGHLGNKVIDQDFAKHLIGHIADKKQTDPLYEGLELQVLFGSQKREMEAGTDVLIAAYQKHYPDNWKEEMDRSTVVHVYDRADPAVLEMASEPYTIEDSAQRITEAAGIAIQKGFTNFSISGELAIAVSPFRVTQFFRSINATLFDKGAKKVRDNLANTYGYSTNEHWNAHTLAAFNAAVKYGFAPGRVTASIHAHNDVNQAVAFSKTAVAAGFDITEGTVKTGERKGNDDNNDTAATYVEASRAEDIAETRQYPADPFADAANQFSVRRRIKLNQRLIEGLPNRYESTLTICTILGKYAIVRFHESGLGDPLAHDNGSGPHDQVLAAAVVDPVNHPGDTAYGWMLMTNNIMGRPGTKEIALGDPEAVDSVTVGNHAGGRKTAMIKNGELKRPSQEVIDEASRLFDERKARIIGRLATGITIYA